MRVNYLSCVTKGIVQCTYMLHIVLFYIIVYIYFLYSFTKNTNIYILDSER